MLFLAASSLENISIVDAGIVALLGYATVFFGLILLMIVVTIVGQSFIAYDKNADKRAAKKAAKAAKRAAKKAAKEGVVPEAVAPAATSGAPTAPGSAGELKLHDVEPKIAAMLMAIVADKMGKPLNELRFISIKEVK